jgi:hypothetical protein
MDSKGEQYLATDLPYEIDMLRETYAASVAGNPDRVVQNALIESWAVHARNLIELFQNPAEFQKISAFVRPYARLDSPIAQSLTSRISDQISHLTLARPKNPDKKVRPDSEVMEVIESEINSLFGTRRSNPPNVNTVGMRDRTYRPNNRCPRQSFCDERIHRGKALTGYAGPPGRKHAD